MKRHDLISSLVWFCAGLFIALYSPQFDLGNLKEPGSGFAPFLAGVLMCILSGITFSQATLEKAGDIKNLWEKVQFGKIIFVFLTLCFYTLLVEKVGFLICTFLLILILIRFTRQHTWLESLLWAVLTSALSFLVFEAWLKLRLPKGILRFLKI
jgi:putative tricarboxylic transport membrane protein